MLQAARVQTRCRQIEVSDLDSIANLLVIGFPGSAKSFWASALELLEQRTIQNGFPRFGYMLESGGAAVGVHLMICSSVLRDGSWSTRCSMSSWYTDPAFRNLAPLLVTRAMKHKPAIFLNDSPAPHTWKTIEVLGFNRFGSGTFVSLPALMPQTESARISEFGGAPGDSPRLAAADRALLSDHRGYGCLCLVCETKDGTYPLIFRREKIWRGLLPAARLIYAPSAEFLASVAGPLGRYLLKRGLPLLLTGASGPLPLTGRFFHGKWPRYYNGNEEPWAGDMAYTERALFGV